MLNRIVDAGWVPERVLRMGIRAVCAQRLRQEARRGAGYVDQLVAELRRSEVAIETAAANAQHYEVPAAFFALVLGPHLKYSSGYWPGGVGAPPCHRSKGSGLRAGALGAAEVAMLGLTAERAGLADGQAVLDLGCGWGSLTLWAAARFPRSRFTAISNSQSQRAYVEEQARLRGLGNVSVRTADVRTVELAAGAFDRVVSIEMFEHMRNYELLLRRIAGWLAPDGALFVHVFAHRRHAYPFEDEGATDWMAREFFTGGIMPSADLLHRFADDLVIAGEWQLDGTHYARTAEAWYANLMANRAEATRALAEAEQGAMDRSAAAESGPRRGNVQRRSRARFERWRVFFLACAELFGFRGGTEWIVAHYLLRPRRR